MTPFSRQKALKSKNKKHSIFWNTNFYHPVKVELKRIKNANLSIYYLAIFCVLYALLEETKKNLYVEYYALNVRSRGKQFCFPESPDVFRDEFEGNIGLNIRVYRLIANQESVLILLRGISLAYLSSSSLLLFFVFSI